MIIKRGLPLAIAVIIGVLTLVSLLLPLPELSNLILGWATFLVAVALLLGVLNLLSVHTGRLVNGRNLYSGILVLSALAVLALGVTDTFGITQDGIQTAFNWIQAPLEAALASLLAFFLLFAGIRYLQRRHSLWAILFLLTAVLVLLSNAFQATTLLPDSARLLFQQIQNAINTIIVTAGMRGLLIGVALGTITLSLRQLIGMDQPYNK